MITNLLTLTATLALAGAEQKPGTEDAVVRLRSIGNTLFVARLNGILESVDLIHNTREWQRKFDGAELDALDVTDRIVYIAYQVRDEVSKIVCCDAPTGKTLWERTASFAVHALSTLPNSDHVLAGGFKGEHGKLATCSEKHISSYPVEEITSFVSCLAQANDKRTIAGTETRQFLIIDPKESPPRFKMAPIPSPFSGRIESLAPGAGARVYCGSSDGVFAEFDAGSRKLIACETVGPTGLGIRDMVVAGEYVVFCMEDELHAYDTANRTLDVTERRQSIWGQINSIALGPGRRQIYCGHNNGAITQWEVRAKGGGPVLGAERELRIGARHKPTSQP